jgi:hypothetical protein
MTACTWVSRSAPLRVPGEAGGYYGSCLHADPPYAIRLLRARRAGFGPKPGVGANRALADLLQGIDFE